MSGDILQHIQELQFNDKPQAESLLAGVIAEVFGLDVAKVELRPLAISLNSFNGYVTLQDGRELFFKSHTESDTIIAEYYNAEMLAEAGYPVIQPVFKSNETSKQILIYEIVKDPSVFDVAWGIETGQSDHLPLLADAQAESDEALYQLYADTLTVQSASEAAKSPIHQLFYHRLTGGRLERFYGPLPDANERNDKPIQLGENASVPLSAVRQANWIINGQFYEQSLDEIITQAIDLLEPNQEQAAVIGHGDAHNGNVFFQRVDGQYQLIYFDPAFAGRHSPLLDITKPIFHNVFAMWMYFPQEKAQKTRIEFKREGNLWTVNHNYAIHPVRRMFLLSKVDRVLIPTLQLLKSKGLLRDDWRAYLKAALFCCPFLTMNLADSAKFPPSISLLGLTMALEMGAESQGEISLIDQTLDDVEAALS
jgi:hypothetical protein